MVIALAWLLPNHYLPWTAFHADAWLAAAVLLGTVAPLVRVSSGLRWTPLACVAMVLSCVPWMQFAGGLLPFGGQAWISSCYLFGFALALLVGYRWEAASPGQLANALFLAIIAAGLLSVWLQLHTWLRLGENELTDIWSMGLSGARPYANVGQPNNLATLLFWGLLGCLWFHLSGRLGAATGVALAMILLVGIALTQSRMGTLALTVMVICVWFWRRLWPSQRMPWISTALYIFFWICPFVFRWLTLVLFADQDASFIRLQEQGELRLTAWSLFAQAIFERPWFGFGWTELRSVQVLVPEGMPALGVSFAHSHNLFLDFVLWVGLPLGLLMVAVVLRWFWGKVRAVQSAQDATLIFVLAAIGVHAMVELPLHYAYFLLPVGLFMGMLDARLGARAVVTTPRWTLPALWLCAALALGVTVRDYLRVEASYQKLQFEVARIGLDKTPIGGPPVVLALTQLREWMLLARYKVHPDMAPQELAWMEALTVAYPAPSALYRLAGAYAVNGRVRDSGKWLGKICRFSDPAVCQSFRQMWEAESRLDPAKAAVPWPVATEARP